MFFKIKEMPVNRKVDAKKVNNLSGFTLHAYWAEFEYNWLRLKVIFTLFTAFWYWIRPLKMMFN